MPCEITNPTVASSSFPKIRGGPCCMLFDDSAWLAWWNKENLGAMHTQTMCIMHLFWFFNNLRMRPHDAVLFWEKIWNLNYNWISTLKWSCGLHIHPELGRNLSLWCWIREPAEEQNDASERSFQTAYQWWQMILHSSVHQDQRSLHQSANIEIPVLAWGSELWCKTN